MNIKARLFAAVCTAALGAGSMANAALYTIDLTGSAGLLPMQSFSDAGGSGLGLEVRGADFNYGQGFLTAYWSDSQQAYLNNSLYTDFSVDQSASGLGICSNVVGQGCSGDTTDVDGGGNGASDEMLVFLFSETVRLVSATFTNVDGNDDFVYRTLDPLGTYYTDGQFAGAGSTQDFGFGVDLTGTMFGIGARDSNDNFKVSSLTFDYTAPIAPIPLPATGLLLLGALGGLAAVRRRKA